MTHDSNQLSDAEAAIADIVLNNQMNFIPKYVEMDYDIVNKRLDSAYATYDLWSKLKFSFSLKRQYRLYAGFTGTDQLFDLRLNIVYDTIRTVEESPRMWDHLWENSNDLIKLLVGAEEAHYITETYDINHIRYKLRYVDGYSGKTMWSMRYRWPSAFFGSKKRDPARMILRKFVRRFPYKIVGSGNK